MFRYKNNILRAFTIVELIIVFIGLVILIGIAYPKIIAMQQNSQLVKAKREVATIMTALESYQTFNPSHSYPSTTATLQASYLINATPAILGSVLYDPFTTSPRTEYSYLCSNNGQYYVVWSVGLPGSVQPSAISNSGVISYE